MRRILYGAALALVVALSVEVACAQVAGTAPGDILYTDEDLLSAALYGVGVILVALGFMSGKQR